MTFLYRPLSCLLLLLAVRTSAQTGHREPSAEQTPRLRYVLILSRHGVRSPTGKAAQYNQYSTGAWPAWPVQPGYLTPHGFQLMENFGEYDRALLAKQGLLAPAGCTQAGEVTIYADSDQRTRETGRALAEGLMPGCHVAVGAKSEGENDPLFHAVPDPARGPSPAVAKAAIAGRIGGDPANLTAAYRDLLVDMDHILATCGEAQPSRPARTPLFDVLSTLAEGSGDHLAEMKGPINIASTLAENLLLEYTEGMDRAQVGWGCVDHDKLQSLLTLHTAATDFTNRTPAIARAQSAGLLRAIGASLQQAAKGTVEPGAVGKPSDRVAILVGHDTNLENIAGALGLTWILDGRRDDTPPGSALVFELWTMPGGAPRVKLSFTAQTLEQMRESLPLSIKAPPARVPVFVPACSTEDMSCSLAGFLAALPATGGARSQAASR